MPCPLSYTNTFRWSHWLPAQCPAGSWPALCSSIWGCSRDEPSLCTRSLCGLTGKVKMNPYPLVMDKARVWVTTGLLWVRGQRHLGQITKGLMTSFPSHSFRAYSARRTELGNHHISSTNLHPAPYTFTGTLLGNLRSCFHFNSRVIWDWLISVCCFSPFSRFTLVRAAHHSGAAL